MEIHWNYTASSPGLDNPEPLLRMDIVGQEYKEDVSTVILEYSTKRKAL